MSAASTINTADDLRSFLIDCKPTASSSRMRGILIVPGGGGKSTIIKCLQEAHIPCSDIDDYWDQSSEKVKVQQMTVSWNEACQRNDVIQRQQIEDEYVLLKAILSKTRWLTDSITDLLFVQTYGQASILMNDGGCLALNLLPTARLHHQNLYKRALDEHPPKDFVVCQRQWQENYEQYPQIFYDDFNEFHRLISLFHQLILARK